jgi:NADPH2:quinone reductase
MKAIVAVRPGGPEVLELVDVPTPSPGAGEVLVRVAASGVNFMDVGMRLGGRAGITFPRIPGGEASGMIEAVGEGVGELRAGDRVMFATPFGTYAQNATAIGCTYAEYALAPAWQLIRIPADLDLVEAAALPLQGMTAHYLLHEYTTIGPGTTVLIHAVAGGMGLLLTQWATHLGAHVIGTTSSAAKAAKAQAMGARDVILYSEKNFADEVMRITSGEGVDLILDAVGKTTFADDLAAVKVRGHIVVYGAASGAVEPLSPNAYSARAATVSGAGLLHFTRTPEEVARRAAAVLNGYREGWLRVTIDRTLPLAQAADAHRALEGRETSGKLLLIP